MPTSRMIRIASATQASRRSPWILTLSFMCVLPAATLRATPPEGNSACVDGVNSVHLRRGAAQVNARWWIVARNATIARSTEAARR